MDEKKSMKVQKFKDFNLEERNTWRSLFNRLDENRRSMAYVPFQRGVKLLGLTEELPDLYEVNAKLMNLTGWKGIPVEGFEEIDTFYPGLSRREFPIGNFIRSPTDLNYTPAPDIFHDLYGHLPLLAHEPYAKFCEAYGHLAMKHQNHRARWEMFERFFWFTIEFGLIETQEGRRIFGGGILSSYGESIYALSSEPEVIPFDIQTIIEQPFRIDEFQKRLFVLKSEDQLYFSLNELEDRIVSSAVN